MATAVDRRGAVGRVPRLLDRASATPWYRSKLLHLALGLAVAVLTVVFASDRATTGARSALDARLLAAGAGADAAVVAVESEQLTAVRAIAFTEGVGAALARGDEASLRRLVVPVQANSTVPMVDVVRPDGQVVLAVRSEGAPGPVKSRAGLGALADALRQANGPRGGRLTEVVLFRSGPTLVTVGAVTQGETAVGAVLAMTPLANVLGRLAQQVGADLTAYDAWGDPIATTAPFTPVPVARDVAQALVAGGAVATRYVHAGRREKLGRLIVDHQAAAVLGVSVDDRSNVSGRVVAIFAALGLVCTVVILATFWARFVITRREA